MVHDVWPTLSEGAAWVEAQVDVESRGVPDAVSPKGAIGLLQLMPGTADDLGVKNSKDPEENVRGGVRYLRQQFDHLAEIPTDEDRLAWSFAAFNGGRGYVNRAVHLARLEPGPKWWRWDIGCLWLMSCDCIVAGRRPDYRQVWDYVERIRAAKAALGRVTP